MSTKAQKRRAACQEEEEPDYVDQSLPRVHSSEFRRVVDNAPSTSVDENMPQDLNELESIKSSLRKEITEEIKVLVAESQNAIIQALRPVNRNETEPVDLDSETTPVRIRSSLNKTLRLNNVEILEPSCSRNRRLYFFKKITSCFWAKLGVRDVTANFIFVEFRLLIVAFEKHQ